MPEFNLLLKVGKFSKAGAISTVLRPHSVDVAKLVDELQKEFSRRGYPIGTKVNVVYRQNAFGESFEIRRVMLSSEILNSIGLSKGSKNRRSKVGNISSQSLLSIVQERFTNGLFGTSRTLEAAWRQACALCFSMGISVDESIGVPTDLNF